LNHADISVLDMNDTATASRAKDLGIKSVPAVVVNGKLMTCCQKGGPNEADLRQAGIGQPLQE